MKLNLLLEIDLPEEDETNASKDLLAFFQQHFNITGISNYDLHILSIRLVDTMAITELNFPEKLNKCMHDNGIYLISDLQNFKLSEESPNLYYSDYSSDDFEVVFAQLYLERVCPSFQSLA